jgi:hypothetical protein
MPEQGILVEGILQANGLYIQAGKVGDRLKHDLNLPKILIEVPDTGIGSLWNKLFLDATVERAREETVIARNVS